MPRVVGKVSLPTLRCWGNRLVGSQSQPAGRASFRLSHECPLGGCCGAPGLGGARWGAGHPALGQGLAATTQAGLEGSAQPRGSPARLHQELWAHPVTGASVPQHGVHRGSEALPQRKTNKCHSPQRFGEHFREPSLGSQDGIAGDSRARSPPGRCCGRPGSAGGGEGRLQASAP